MVTEIPVPDVPRPDDFDSFWEDALSEARQYGLNPVVTEDPLRSNDRTIVYKVSFTSLERVRVGGWYAVPCGAGPFPALQMVPGYSMHANLSVRALAEQGIATLWLSIRGHDFDSQIIPGFPGFLCHNITDRHRYIYRGGFCDAVRGIDFLRTRDEIDQSRVAVAGSSQGGALTLVTAALADDIIAATPDVPFLTNYRYCVATSSSYPYAEIADLLRAHPELEESLWDTVAYFDTVNFAPAITCPVLLAVGLQDDICPAPASLVMAESISGPVELAIYPDAAHEAGTAFAHAGRKMDWLKAQLGARPL